MFVKNLSLCLCVLSFFALDQVEAALGENYFKQKKYDFSEPVLDETKAFFAIAMKAVSVAHDEAEEVFLRMWEEALQGNEKIQQKLFCLFTNPNFYAVAKNRVSLLEDDTKYSLKILMDIALEQEKSWAFYQKALIEKNRGKKFTLLNQAMNNPNVEEALFEKIKQERNSLIKEFGLPIPNGKNKNEIKKFVTHYKNYKNGGFLYIVYENCKKSDKILAEECFKAATELGYCLSCIDLSNQSFLKGDRENNYKWSLKPAKLGDPMSMHNVGSYLANNGQVEEGVKWLLQASEAGVVEAMYSAAYILNKYFDGPISQAKSFHLMKTAAQLGHMQASRKYAQMLKDGFAGHEPNLKEAADLFLKVIKSDDAEQKDKSSAMYHYGRLLKEGFEGQRPNMNLGYDWILKAAKNGCPSAMNHYGGFLMGWMDDNVEKNMAAAYRWFLKAAKAGDHASMINVAEMLWFGVKGVKQNRKAAKEWLYKAVNVGYLDAMILLSRDLLSEALEEGVSVEDKEKLLKEGARLLSLAYDCNYFSCLVGSDLLLINKNKSKFNSFPDIKFDNDTLLTDKNIESDTSEQSDVVQISVEPYVALKTKHIISLDQLLKNERIVHDKTQKKIKALIRCAFSVDLKDKVNSLVNLAELYFMGYVDGEKNIKKAFDLLLPIAKNNHVAAMNYVGKLLLQETEEQKPNYKKAFKWFKRAAENGHADSMVRLGSLILFSVNFFENDQALSDALFWFQKAHSLGNKEATEYLVICENLLKENAELVVTDEEISDFVEVYDASTSNKNLHPLVIPNKLEDNDIHINKDECVEASEFDDALVHVVLDECVVKKNLNYINKDVQYAKNNPKFQRQQLRKIGLLKKSQENKENNINDFKLSEKNQLIVDMLLDKSVKNKNIGYAQLVNLFEDPFFENQVQVNTTKSGCIITAKNYKTLDYVVTSTHKKHNRDYDGLNPFFARDLIKILVIFGLTEG